MHERKVLRVPCRRPPGSGWWHPRTSWALALSSSGRVYSRARRRGSSPSRAPRATGLSLHCPGHPPSLHPPDLCFVGSVRPQGLPSKDLGSHDRFVPCCIHLRLVPLILSFVNAWKPSLPATVATLGSDSGRYCRLLGTLFPFRAKQSAKSRAAGGPPPSASGGRLAACRSRYGAVQGARCVLSVSFSPFRGPRKLPGKTSSLISERPAYRPGSCDSLKIGFSFIGKRI